MSSGVHPLVETPFVDLRAIHESISGELLAELAELVDSGTFINGPQVSAFESAFADWCGADHCVGTASGLDALRLALIARGLESGDEVVVPAMTFVATAEAVTQAGGTVVLADISDRDWNLDPAAAEAALTDRARLLLPVHLYGQMADVAALAEVAERRGLELVEDACQAHGASRDGVRAGTAGRAAAFSFYPGKNLGAMGDAGALVTDDGALAEAVRVLREHGQRRKYEHDVEGWTARLDTIQAIVLSLKLPLLDAWNDARRRAAAFYEDGLAGVGDLVRPPVPVGSAPVWHLYVVRTAEPESLAAFLENRGIATGRHYPIPVHLTGAYGYLGYQEGAFPVAERLARECLSLPIFPGIADAQLAAVVEGVASYFTGRGR